MKLIGLIFGIAIAWGITFFAPSVLPSLILATGFSTAIAAIAALLTSQWGVAFSRLSAFEKIDDLTGNQKQIVSDKSKLIRNRIILSIAMNTITVVLSIVILLVAPIIKPFIETLIPYWLLGCLGFWTGGFFQAIKCVKNIEESKQSILLAQAAEKERATFLKTMREDEAKNPVDRNDAHLKKYNENFKSG